MKLIHYLYIVPIALLSACAESNELNGNNAAQPDASRPNGAIELSAGIVEGGSAATTRSSGSETYHGSHKVLTENTKLALQVSGTWTGHTPARVVQTTTATISSETGSETKHNNVVFTPTEKLYWDDYGTADEANALTGRTEGLTIYGAAINGKTDAALTVGDWTALIWTLAADQTTGENIPAKKDLLISNNVQPAPGASTSNDGTYKFTERGSGKLLEFRHALSKITVNLLAGDGFDGVFGSIAVELKSNGTTWPYTTGTVNITTGEVTGLGGNTTVTMAQTATASTGYTVTKEALVMPGSEFADATDLLRINADGNIYYVSSAKIRTAIATEDLKTGDDYLALAGKNYVFNITVNKTEIDVTATVVDWTTVTAASEAPIINISVSFGNPIATRFRYDQFSFYRSLELNDKYSWNISGNDNGFYKPESRITHSLGSMWNWDPPRYWSDHNTHYQFRLVWPRATTETKVADPYHPHVERKTYDDGSTYYQVIEIANEAYEKLYTPGDDGVNPVAIVDDATHHPYPSNLMIARPEIFDNPATEDVNEQLCTNHETGHTTTNLYTGGICATEGTINLTFRYVMCQVEVNLTTTSTASSVNLDGAVVEITNVYRTGDVKLGDRKVIHTGSTGSYILDAVPVEDDDPATVDINENTVSKNKRWSAIVPQPLTYGEARATTNVQFKITLANGDVYYADVAPIKKTSSSDKVAPNGEWESGYHYVYTLNISKTAIRATATLADWTTVNATEEVWF